MNNTAYQSKTKDLPIELLAKTLARQIDKKDFERKYAPVRDVLILVGAGVFLAAAIAIPNLPLVLKPFLKNKDDYEVWKRFNIPYLKRTLARLEKQKLVSVKEGDIQTITITEDGKRKILRYALDALVVEKPKFWDGTWQLVSYDIPAKQKRVREILSEYLRIWKFYPLHESVYLHAYPCEKEVEFLREYLGIGEYVRIFHVSKIENDKLFREFFDV